jgi:protein associated with RNAse G/E
VRLDDRPRIRSASTKWDGSIHYEFDTFLLDQTDGCLRLFIPEGTPHRSYRGEGVFEVDSIGCFFPGDDDRSFNVITHLRPSPKDGLVMAADILAAAHLDGGTLRWIDLDLDVEVFEDGRVELVDEDEFEEHQRRFGYPAEVIEGARRSAELARSNRFPFDWDQTLKWVAERR